jgi:hypothetical protein
MHLSSQALYISLSCEVEKLACGEICLFMGVNLDCDWNHAMVPWNFLKQNVINLKSGTFLLPGPGG